jgi:hypothetical protein
LSSNPSPTKKKKKNKQNKQTKVLDGLNRTMEMKEELMDLKVDQETVINLAMVGMSP